MPLSPPRPPHPPLNALRAFEAAGRLGSFLRAAEELSVTPGAIAQQIRKLEEWAGGSLFQRHAQGVSLTPLGRQVLPDLIRAFDSLGQVAGTLRLSAGRADVRIAALPAVAQLWLSPRLSNLRAALPGADLSIHALDTCPPLSRGSFDLAVYPVAAGDRGGRVLAPNRLMPVAAPAVANAIRGFGDLKDAALIHDLAWKDDWRAWLAAHGIGGIDAERGAGHSLYSIAVERCVAGDGVLIGHSALVARHLREGSLRPVFPGHDMPGPPLCLMVADRPRDAMLARVVAALSAAA